MKEERYTLKFFNGGSIEKIETVKKTKVVFTKYKDGSKYLADELEDFECLSEECTPELEDDEFLEEIEE